MTLRAIETLKMEINFYHHFDSPYVGEKFVNIVETVIILCKIVCYGRAAHIGIMGI
jgi:hypothetical protein